MVQETSYGWESELTAGEIKKRLCSLMEPMRFGREWKSDVVLCKFADDTHFCLSFVGETFMKESAIESMTMRAEASWAERRRAEWLVRRRACFYGTLSEFEGKTLITGAFGEPHGDMGMYALVGVLGAVFLFVISLFAGSGLKSALAMSAATIVAVLLIGWLKTGNWNYSTGYEQAIDNQIDLKAESFKQTIVDLIENNLLKR